MTAVRDTFADGVPFAWRRGVGRRLVVAIVLFSSAVTLVLTALNLYLDYSAGINAIHRRLGEIEQVYAGILGEGVWSLDRRGLQMQAEGIARLPGIRAITIREIEPNNATPMLVSVGEPLASMKVVRDIALPCSCNGSPRVIGTLHVEATLTDLFAELLRRAGITLVGQGLKTFLVSAFILLIVHRLVTRHLLDIAAAITRFSRGGAPVHLQLRRAARTDELSLVVEAFNESASANARMEAILDNIPDLAWVKDSDGRFVAANRPLAAVFGYSDPAELIGKTDFDLSPPDIAEAYQRGDREVMVSGRAQRYEERHVGKDGMTFQIESIKTPLRDGNGTVIGVVGIARDITERKLLEEELHQTVARQAASERKFRQLAENSPSVIVRYDRQYRRVYVNPAYQRQTTLSSQDVVARVPDAQTWLGTLSYDDYIGVLRKVMETGDATQIELGWPTPDGRHSVYALNIAAEYDDAGRVVGALTIGTDITALKSTERQLRTLVDHFPDAIVRFDRECRFAYANPACYQKFRVTPERLLGRTLAEVEGPSAQTETMTDSIRRVFEEARPRDLETRWPTRLGERIMEIRHVPEFDEQGRVVSVLGLARDITEQKRAEEELRATTLKLETLVRNLPGNVFQIRYRADNSKELLFHEGVMVEKFGFARQTKFTPEMFHPDDGYLLFEEVPRRLRETGQSVQTFRAFLPGGMIWLRAWERVVETLDDGFITEGITLDVTPEIEAKQALENSERMYRDLVTMTAVGVAGVDAAGQCIYVNERFLELTGLRRDEFLGQGWVAAIHPDDRQRVVDDVQRSYQASAAYRDEYRILRRGDGHLFWVLGQSVPHHDADGKVAGWVSVVTDITDRKIHEEAQHRINLVLRTLAAAHEVLMQATDKAAVYAGICRVLVDTGGYRMAWIGLAESDRRVLPVAHAGADDGYLDSLRITWNDTPLGRGPTGTAIRTGMFQINNDTASNDAMKPWCRNALARHYRSSIALPLKAEGSVLGCLNIYHDTPRAFPDEEAVLLQDLANAIAFAISAIRERRRREEIEHHLHQVQKMEALGQVAGSVAHDFNNLLGAIMGFANFIVEDAADGSSARYHGQRILAAGRRGKALIGQVLSFARSGDLKRERFAVKELLSETLVLLTACIPATTKIELEVTDDGMAVLGDRDLLGQALINLCINAHDSLGGAAGTIAITARPTDFSAPLCQRLLTRESHEAIEVWWDEPGIGHAVAGSIAPAQPCVSLVVADTGCGMDRAVMDKLFTPFFTTKDKGHGTGLGLASIQGTALAHQGGVVVESRPGHGSRFEMVLPLSVEVLPAAPKAKPVKRASGVAGLRVLLVDDDPDFGDMMLTALERRGAEVSPCADALEALAGIRDYAGAFDALVTDQTMPQMSGLDLIRAAKAIRPDLPCILCTGYAEDRLDEKRLKDVGVLTLLRKPIDIEELVSLLAGIRDRK